MTIPAVVFRRNRSRWMVALPFEDLLVLVKEARAAAWAAEADIDLIAIAREAMR